MSNVFIAFDAAETNFASDLAHVTEATVKHAIDRGLPEDDLRRRLLELT